MADIQTFDDLKKKLLDQHHEQYTFFTRLVLSLSTASFSLLAAFNGSLLASAQFTALAKAAFPLLVVSMLSGVYVQYQIMVRPLDHLREAEQLTNKALAAGDPHTPILMRRIPSKGERFFFNAQVLSFLAAFCGLALYVFLRS